MTPISLWDLTPKVSGYGLLSGSWFSLRFTSCPYLPMLSVTTAFSGCPFAATPELNRDKLLRPCGFHTFIATSRTKRFLLPTRRRSDFLGVVCFSCESLLTHNPSESYDSLELLHPTQPKLQSASILPRCKQLSKTPESVSEESSSFVHFSCEMVTGAAFTINSLASLAISLLCFALTGVACVAPSSQPRLL